MKKQFLKVVSFLFLSLITSRAFANDGKLSAIGISLNSGAKEIPFLGASASIAVDNVGNNPMMGQTSGVPKVDITLVPEKCSALSVGVVLVEDSIRSMNIFLSKDPQNPCHFSGTADKSLILSDGGPILEEIAIEVGYPNSSSEWLNDPTGSHNAKYRFIFNR